MHIYSMNTGLNSQKQLCDISICVQMNNEDIQFLSIYIVAGHNQNVADTYTHKLLHTSPVILIG
jgi:hypothetical protein